MKVGSRRRRGVRGVPLWWVWETDWESRSQHKGGGKKTHNSGGESPASAARPQEETEPREETERLLVPFYRFLSRPLTPSSYSLEARGKHLRNQCFNTRLLPRGQRWEINWSKLSSLEKLFYTSKEKKKHCRRLKEKKITNLCWGQNDGNKRKEKNLFTENKKLRL